MVGREKGVSEERSIPVRLNLSQEIHDRLRLIAAANRCSMAEWIRQLVIPAIEGHPVGNVPALRSRLHKNVESRTNSFDA